MTRPIERFLVDRIADGWMAGAAWSVGPAEGSRTRGVAGSATRVPRLEPLCETTVFDLASLTKPLATGLLLALAEQAGRVDPAAPAVESLDELGGSPWAAVSLDALSTHTAGLPAWAPLYFSAGSAEQYVEAIARLTPAGAPGRAIYSDLGYILLGIALERSLEGRLDELFAAQVADPLGLTDLGFIRSGETAPDAAATEQGNRFERELAAPEGAGYRFRQGLIRGEVHDLNAYTLGGVAGHAGLFGSLGAVATLAAEIVRPRRLPLGSAAQARLLAVRPKGDGRTSGFVTAGRSRAAAGILPDDAPGHTGFTGTSVWLEPSDGRLYVLLTNRVHPRVSQRDFQLVRRGFHRLGRRDRKPSS